MEKKILSRKDKLIFTGYLLGVLVFYMIFFGKLHPIAILDTDDWFYLYNTRYALPLWGIWNPAKILPEILMPATVKLGVYVFGLFEESFFKAVALASALVVSLFLTVFNYELIMYFAKIRKAAAYEAITVGLFYNISQFLIFRTALNNNEYMLHSIDATCYFNYIIPSLLGAILVLYLMRENLLRGFFGNGDYGRKSFVVLAIYLQIFSNLFSSIILASFLGIGLLYALIVAVKTRSFKFKTYVAENCAELLILMAWGVAHVFELSGGRAGEESGSFIEGLIKAFGEFVFAPAKMNGTFKLVLLLILFGSVAVLFLFKKGWIKYPSSNNEDESVNYSSTDKEDESVNYSSTDKADGSINNSPTDNVDEGLNYSSADGKDRIQRSIKNEQIDRNKGLILILGSFGLTTVYLLLLCGKLNKYANRPDAMYGVFFFLMMIFMILLSDLLKKVPVIRLAIPVLLLVMLSATDTLDRTFTESNEGGLTPDRCFTIDEDLMYQVMFYYENGYDEMTLYVPDFNTEDNWPIAEYGAQRIPDCLYKYGIIDRKITVTEVVREGSSY